MSNVLFPVFDAPEEADEDEDLQAQYAPAPMWDMEKGDFVTDGSGRMLYGSGLDAWALWCVKAVMTQRWAHGAYSENEGIEAEESFAEPDREAAESSFERTVTEALLADPEGRTVQVRDFEFDWEPDSLRISCEIVGSDGIAERITAMLDR